MKRFAVLPLLLLTFCASGRGTGSTPAALPGRGAISIEVVPNPIIATKVSGNRYDFPFEVILRETGGRDVILERVSADVYAFGTLRVGSESYDAAQITKLGYSTRIPANGTIHYRFTPRREVEDDRLFSSVTTEVKAEGREEGGAPVTATTTVTVRR